MKKYTIATVVSNLFDIVVSSILGGIYMVIIVGFYHLDLKEISANPSIYSSFVGSNHLLYSISFIIGAMVSVSAGYLAAKIAKDKYLLMGGLSSILCVLGGLVSFSSKGVIFGIIFIILSPVLGVIGGYLYRKRIEYKLM